MDFQLNDEQLQLKKSVREFAEREIAPHVMEWDEASHFPLEIMPKLAEMGLLGVIFPENTAEPDWVISNMRWQLRNWLGWTARWD